MPYLPCQYFPIQIVSSHTTYDPGGVPSICGNCFLVGNVFELASYLKLVSEAPPFGVVVEVEELIFLVYLLL